MAKRLVGEDGEVYVLARNPRASMTHCHRGHPLSGENVYRYGGRRYCKTCQRERRRRLRKEVTAAAS